MMAFKILKSQNVYEMLNVGSHSNAQLWCQTPFSIILSKDLDLLKSDNLSDLKYFKITRILELSSIFNSSNASY